jgi:O-antigen ligase
MTDSTETISERVESRWITVARIALLLTAFLPIVLYPHFLFPFVTPRNIFFRICVELALASILLAGIRRLRDTTGQKDPVLVWFFAYVIAISVAALSGLSPWHSLFGDFERMGGIWAWLHLLLFYLVLRVVFRARDWTIFFRCILAVADLVVICGSLEFLPMTVRNPAFQLTLIAGSTIGNPGLLGPYLMLSLMIAALLLMEERAWGWKSFSMLSGLAVLFGIAGSRNRSAQLGVLAGLGVAFAVMFFLRSDRRRFVRRYLAGALAGIVLFVLGGYGLSQRAPALAERFAGRWKYSLGAPIDHIRTIEWEIALAGFKDRPLLGYGPENHEIVVSHNFDPSIYQIISGGGVFDRTHNAWLELLATSGIIGMVAMAGLWIAAIQTVRTGVRERSLKPRETALLSGALAAYAVYLTFWFFDLNSAFIWVVLLAFLSNRVRGRPEIGSTTKQEAGASRFGRIAMWATVILIALSAYLHGIVPLIAAHDLSVAAEDGMFQPRLEAFYRVMNSASPQTLHTFPLYYQFLRSSSGFMAAPTTNPFLRKEFDLALQRGMIEADRSISRNPRDDRSYVNAARFEMMTGLIYRDSRYLTKAREQLRTGIGISPRRPDIRVLLATVYLSLGDSASASAQLDSAMVLAPMFGPTFFYGARLANARHDPDSAAVLLLVSLRRGFSGTDALYGDVAASLVRRGENLRAARLTQAFLESIYGPMKNWTSRSVSAAPRNSQVADSLARSLPIAYLKGGDTRLALASAAAEIAIHPEANAEARAFVADVLSGNYEKWKTKTLLDDGAR